MAIRFLSVFLLLSLLLPAWIGLVHSFHDHDTTICYAKTEQHVHQDKTSCDQLHYFSQTLATGEVGSDQTPFKGILIQNPIRYKFDLAYSFPKSDPDRGPPAINV